MATLPIEAAPAGRDPEPRVDRDALVPGVPEAAVIPGPGARSKVLVVLIPPEVRPDRGIGATIEIHRLTGRIFERPTDGPAPPTVPAAMIVVRTVKTGITTPATPGADLRPGTGSGPIVPPP
ncbi:MAG: hypothetical protein U1G08_06600 [Verrucomicrobiota bacterium]